MQRADVDRLRAKMQAREWLNDQDVLVGLQLLARECERERGRDVLVLDSLVVARVHELLEQDLRERVLSMRTRLHASTRGMHDLRNYDVLVPVHHRDHWTLLVLRVVDTHAADALHLDSLQRVADHCKTAMQYAYAALQLLPYEVTLRTFRQPCNVAQQSDYNLCGAYVLLYADALLHTPHVISATLSGDAAVAEHTLFVDSFSPLLHKLHVLSLEL